jgi:hypothetical protein
MVQVWSASDLPSREGIHEMCLFTPSVLLPLEGGIQGAAALVELGVELHCMETERMEEGAEHGKDDIQDVEHHRDEDPHEQHIHRAPQLIGYEGEDHGGHADGHETGIGKNVARRAHDLKDPEESCAVDDDGDRNNKEGNPRVRPDLGDRSCQRKEGNEEAGDGQDHPRWRWRG